MTSLIIDNCGRIDYDNNAIIKIYEEQSDWSKMNDHIIDIEAVNYSVVNRSV